LSFRIARSAWHLRAAGLEFLGTGPIFSVPHRRACIMQPKNPLDWMLSEALDQLTRAERLRQQFGRQEACWEPPIDVLETEHELLILVALPGVNPDNVETVIHDGVLVISGQRTLPPELRNARIHRLELPQGRFERRIALPVGRYAISRFVMDGCVALRLAKS
jgi:HSP20 family protein